MASNESGLAARSAAVWRHGHSVDRGLLLASYADTLDVCHVSARDAHILAARGLEFGESLTALVLGQRASHALQLLAHDERETI